MKLTTEQKKQRLEASYQSWLRADDEKKKERGVFVVGRFDAMVRKWFLRRYREGER